MRTPNPGWIGPVVAAAIWFALAWIVCLIYI